MIGPIVFVLILALSAILPALIAWSIFRKNRHLVRLLAALLGGQIIVTPAIALIAFSKDRAGDEDPLKTVLLYCGMALILSIMTFAVREMIRVQSER